MTVIFGSFHLPVYIEGGMQSETLTLAIILASLFGLLFGLIYLRTGSLWLPVALALHLELRRERSAQSKRRLHQSEPGRCNDAVAVASDDGRNQLGERGRFGNTGICDDCVRDMAVVEKEEAWSIRNVVHLTRGKTFPVDGGAGLYGAVNLV